MADSFFFYDLETSGFSPSAARIMQFAGQRTDADLKPIGDPVNLLIKLAPDVLPDPDAILITGITPQSTLLEGLTEAEFLDYFYKEVVTPDTTFLGFNTVRFDDEFMRNIHYRNFYDPYAWQWADGCSRWDLLDVVRMTRALRPEGISWPVDDKGRPTNRLQALTTANGLNHEQAHDALSDVHATIAVAQLIKTKQPELFSFLCNNRGKRAAGDIVRQGQPFVYTSGRYPSECFHTTAAIMIAHHTTQDSAIVYDLRYDPTLFMNMSPEQLIASWRYKAERADDDPRLPVKTVKFNRCPAVAPLGVIKDPLVQERIGVSLETIEKHRALLREHQTAFGSRVTEALRQMDETRAADYPQQSVTLETVDSMMYDGFMDKQSAQHIRQADPADITQHAKQSSDKRVPALAALYKARNYPSSLDDTERKQWDDHIAKQLYDGGDASRLAAYFKRLAELSTKADSSQQFLLEELQLYGESIVPGDVV